MGQGTLRFIICTKIKPFGLRASDACASLQRLHHIPCIQLVHRDPCAPKWLKYNDMRQEIRRTPIRGFLLSDTPNGW